MVTDDSWDGMPASMGVCEGADGVQHAGAKTVTDEFCGAVAGGIQ